MIQVSIDDVAKDLSSHLQMAEDDYVVITRQGEAIGILIGLEDPEDWWEELLLHNPRFLDSIDQARQNLKKGKGTTIEELREQYKA